MIDLAVRVEENIAIILQKQAYAKIWSGMEPWSGVFFGVAFLQNKSCVLIPESADASKWNTKLSYCENERLQVQTNFDGSNSSGP